MTFDRPLYIVVCAHHNGPYVAEVDIDRMDRASIERDLRNGQFGRDVTGVIELDLVNHRCRDATHDFETFFERPAD